MSIAMEIPTATEIEGGILSEDLFLIESFYLWKLVEH